MKTVLVAILLICLPAALVAQRVALVIGNSEYTSVAELDNPRNDSADVSRALARQGFEVITANNLGRIEMRDTLRRFRQKADQSSVALVYYAGHGIEIGGQNYLVPVDSRLEDERDAELELIQLDLVLRQISGARDMRMVVLDACRNNPFVERMNRKNPGRNVAGTLGRVTYAEADTLIAFAAAAGGVTPDGVAGGNSPFTAAFLRALEEPPKDVRRLLGRVRDFMRESLPEAAPFVYSSLGGREFVINPSSRAPDPATTPTPDVMIQGQAPQAGATASPDNSISRDFIRIDRNGSIEDWDDFLIRYASRSDHPLYAFALEKREALRPGPTDLAAIGTRGTVVSRPSPVPVIPVLTVQKASLQIQALLKARECYAGTIDGVLGADSQAALARFAKQAEVAVSVGKPPEIAELASVIEVLTRNPGVTCPGEARAKPPENTPKPATVRRTPPKPGHKKPATPAATAPTGPDTQKVQGSSNATSRRDATKLAPVSPSDCIGNRAKFYDCD